MARTISIGIQDFLDIRKNNYFYIDKTSFIKEWWENGDTVSLITRPRRFGKTLTMDMVNKFFNINYKDDSYIFEGLSIWNEEYYQNIQGTYPVIYLSFAQIKTITYESTKIAIKKVITALYNSYDFLLNSDILNDNEKRSFKSINKDMSENDVITSLNEISIYLNKYYQKKVIIILDEYDTPMQEAYVNGFWDELSSFMRSFFNSTFKTNPSLERGIMTGITRVSKESIFSDLNNLEVVTTTSQKYKDSFGFKEDEVFEALKEYDLYEYKEDVKDWYDGFTFGDISDIYNPWSIINYLDKRKFACYWTNTSGNKLISQLMQRGNKKVKLQLEDLIKGNSIKTEIDEQIIFNQLDKNENAKWSLLLASGYLRVDEVSDEFKNTGRNEYTLSIVNNETRYMFNNLINEWFGETGYEYSEFVKALLKDKLEEMNVYMNDVSEAVFSYFDSSKKPSRDAPERFYHGFVLGLIVELRGRYVISSNPESGLGRCDVMMEPVNEEDDGIIIEFKVYNPKKEKTLEETVRNALKQIEEKRYESKLKEKGIQNIRKYGFAFKGKEVLIDKF